MHVWRKCSTSSSSNSGSTAHPPIDTHTHTNPTLESFWRFVFDMWRLYIAFKWCGLCIGPVRYTADASMHHFKCKWCDQAKSFCLHRNDALPDNSELMVFRTRKNHLTLIKSCQTELLILQFKLCLPTKSRLKYSIVVKIPIFHAILMAARCSSFLLSFHLLCTHKK